MRLELEGDRRERRRRRLVAVWVPLLFGFLSLFNAVGRPRIAGLHGSDIVQLIATGMCFGVALATAITLFRERDT